jgi:hypothetical protein
MKTPRIQQSRAGELSQVEYYASLLSSLEPGQSSKDHSFAERISHLSRKQRQDVARYLARWCDYLLVSTGDGELPVGRPRQNAQVPKNFFLVNMSAWEQAEFRAMAECWGAPLRSVIRWALISQRAEFERQFGIKTGDAAKLSKRERRSLARRREALRRVSCFFRVETN